MKTRLFASMALTAAILFTSCSKELDQNNIITEIKNSPIAFGTYSGVTKGIPMNNTTFPVVGNKFNVTGFLTTSGAKYMSAVIINKTTGVGKDGIWDYDNALDKAYWPDANLDFYAVTPSTLTTTFGSESTSFTYNVPATTADHKDVMYAITSNQGNPGFGNNVTMQFKHTLNQIHFKGKTDSKNLNVTIAANGIQLVKLNNTGKFTFSKNETPATAWSDVTGAETFTSVNNLVTINTDTEATAAQQITDLTDVMMLIPQAVTPWDNTTANAPASQTGAYLAITCHIYHKEGATSVDLYGSESTPKTLFIPFPGTNMNLMGKRITYTLVFGGGYDEKGDPILNPITFDTTVDNWTDLESGEIIL